MLAALEKARVPNYYRGIETYMRFFDAVT